MSMSLDLSGLAEAFGGGVAAGGPAPEDMVINMTMYVFGRGDLAGGILSMSFGDTPAGVDELALAQVVDAKLQAAQ